MRTKKNTESTSKRTTSTYDPFILRKSFDDKYEFIRYINLLRYKTVKTNKGTTYVNLPAEIDIEVSSFRDSDGEKVGLMYCFTFGINGRSYLGRTKEDMLYMFKEVIDAFELSERRRMIFYVHNLSYEFQFIMKWFEWRSVFALKSRTPAKAVTFDGIEFRCSYLLSGYSLAKVGEHLQKYKVDKKVGDLDYRLIRTPDTPLTKKEEGYVLNDGLVVMAYIQEQIESHGNNITRIPLTKTGEVRKYCRDMCLYGGGGSHKRTGRDYLRYHWFIHNLNIRSVSEYKQLKRAFAGGFTHANPLIVGTVHKDVASLDETSAYPFAMLSEKYPMTNGRLVNVTDKGQFERYVSLYACVFDASFTDIESLIWFEHYISQSRCWSCVNAKVDNGRIIKADSISITLTEQDYEIIKRTYRWGSLRIKNLRIYKKDYLPKEFILAILGLYKNKTELKGVEGMEAEYLNSKELLNSCYGMTVTDICREETSFSKEDRSWDDEHKPIDYERNLEKYNDSKQRFLAYQWGVWVTAYARKRLWRGILGCSDMKTGSSDYLYSDTDSLKIINMELHQAWFDEDNRLAVEKLQRMCDHYKIPYDMVSPMTKEGKIKTLGLWEHEYDCDFKTLGAKRYMVRKKGKYDITVSGLNKKTTMDYILTKTDDPFSFFKDDMHIPATYEKDGKTMIGAGKNTHTYIDVPREGIVKDYEGHYHEYHIDTCIHMEEADYTLSLASEFIDLLLHIERMEYN